MKKFIAIFSSVLAATALVVFAPQSAPASANSAQTSWSGTTSTGAIVIGEECPVVVERENLIFDINQFPSNYYETYEDFLAYDSTVTAVYHLYNPAGYEVTVNLAFPFGKMPDYYSFYAEEQPDPAADNDRYFITVDGERVERTLRHTFSYERDDYDNATDKARLRDGYMSEGVFSLQSAVTVYGYTATIPGAGQYDYFRATAPFPDFDGEKTALLCSVNGADGNARQFSNSCRDGEVFYIYTIGQPIDPMIWSIEGGSCPLTEHYQTTLGEFVMSSYDESSGISRTDWFNAVCDGIIESRSNYASDFVSYRCNNFSVEMGDLLRWYTYSVTIPAGGRAVNCVTAPIYPAINMRSTPYFTYEYLLSPATDWAQFANLTITINTPYYLNASKTGEFTECEGGYTASFDGLPSGELAFILSNSPGLPVSFDRIPYYDPYENLGTYIIIGIIVAGAAGVCIWLIVRRARRKKLSAKSKG